MKKQEFEKFVSQIVKQNVRILKPEDNTKYARYFGDFEEIEPSTKYGIYFDEMIQYDFKTTKKVDSFMKSFVNQHISKYEMKQPTFEMIDGVVQYVYPKKEDVIKKFRDQNRVNKYFFYTTLYGIGMFAFFTKNIAEATVELAKYLKSKKIEYFNEYSEAGWVYRFVINKDVKKHNQLLENFEM